MSPWKSVAFDAFAGVLTALSVLAVVSTTPFWPHGGCATGVNEPAQYAFGLVPFGVRCLLVRRLNRGRDQALVRGFPVIIPVARSNGTIPVHSCSQTRSPSSDPT